LFLSRAQDNARHRAQSPLTDLQDVAGAEVENGHVLLISDPRGCSGGMADGWLALQQLCLEATGEAESAAVLFQAARDHVHEMGESSEAFVLGRHRISAETFDGIIQSCYERALRMARKEFHHMEDVDVVTICGSATASNAHIKSLWLRHVEQWRQERQTTTGNAKLKVDVLRPEDAV
jgi:hypothetical protein